MARFDVESFEDYFTTLLKDNLDAAIAAVNSEKGDGSLIETISTSAWFTEMNEVVNFSPFVLCGVVETEPQGASVGGTTPLKITQSVEVVFQEANDGTATTRKRLWRYTRAILDVLKDDSINTPSAISDLEIVPYAPVTITAQENATLRIGGVQITGAITI